MDNQTLYLANDLFNGFIETDHPKRATICRGHRDIKLDLLTFISTNPANQQEIDWFIRGSVVGFTHKIDGARHIAETVLVTEVHYKRFNSISDKEAQNCGYESVEYMFKCMQHFYATLAWTDEMTFVFFELQCDFLQEEEKD